MAGPRGVEYWVEVESRTRALTFPASSPATSPDTIRITVAGLAEGASHPGGRYRMLSIPLDFGADFSGSLADLLSGHPEFGPYNPVRWRAFRYDPGLRAYVELSPAQAVAFRPVPGRAFWLISRSAHRVDTAPVSALSTATGGDLAIVLAPGWNQIGDPFDFPVAWGSVRKSSMVDDPVAFDPALGTYARAPVLRPFEGYFVENRAPEPETIWVPPAEEPATEPPGAAEAPTPAAAGPDSWMVHLCARTEAAFDGANYCGIHPRAADEFDPLDQRKPPPIPGPWVQLAFANPAWRERPGLYRGDLRAPAEGHAWEIELRSARAGETIGLDLTPDSPLPQGLELLLLDLEQGSSIEINPAGRSLVNCQLLSLGPDRPYRLKLVAGTAEYVAGTQAAWIQIPAQVVLDQNAPNPWREATRIRFGLPRADRVRLEVYNVAGQRVATLANEAMPPGYHTVLWDGATATGRRAPSGVYFYRLTAGSNGFTRRLVIVR